MDKFIDFIKEQFEDNGIDPERMVELMIEQWENKGFKSLEIIDLFNRLPHPLNNEASSRLFFNSILNENNVRNFFDNMDESISDFLDDDVNEGIDFYDMELNDPTTKWDTDSYIYSKEEKTDIELFKAISCSTILSYNYKNNLNTISLGLSCKDAKDLLFNNWNIKNLEDIKLGLNWSKQYGLKDTFQIIWNVTKSINPNLWFDEKDDITQEVMSLQNDYIEENIYIDNFIYNYPFLKDYINMDNISENFIAWDYCKIIYMVRIGYDAGILSYEEAKNEILQSGKIIQQSYNSWSNMSSQFLVAMSMWESDENNLNDAVHSHFMLLNNSKSPWQLLDW
jgi:hypothetical protein